MSKKSIKEEYIKLSDKFLNISMREQVLIVVCGVVAVALLLYTFLLSPTLEKTAQLENKITSINTEIQGLSVLIAQLSAKLEEDPDAPVKARIQALQLQIENINLQLNAKTDNLVPANKMANVLESVLADSKGLKLIELQSIAPVPILQDDQEKQQIGLYRHGVALEFEGKYFDIQQYLEKLESLPWQFYWKKFDYLVSEYPTATVKLEIYTLSTNQAFIGV